MHRSLAALTAAGALTACATPHTATQPTLAAAVPASLKPPASETMAFSHHARGVQIYRCELVDNAHRWVFVAPEAKLFADARSQAALGHHGEGPFWQMSDGSKVVGKVQQRADAPVPVAIPWLLLSTTSAGGAGKMAPVTSIQRINTVGGAAPRDGCAAAANVGQLARVPYTADYIYFSKGS